MYSSPTIFGQYSRISNPISESIMGRATHPETKMTQFADATTIKREEEEEDDVQRQLAKQNVAFVVAFADQSSRLFCPAWYYQGIDIVYRESIISICRHFWRFFY